MYYNDDRSFTDKVHDEVSVPLIYSRFGWHDSYAADPYEDNNFAVDYHAKDINDTDIIIQERFRRSNVASKFKDFTLRYQRPNERQHYSEIYKIYSTALKYVSTPFFMVYGTVTASLNLLRFVVVDLHNFVDEVSKGHIIIGTKDNIFSSVENDIFYSGLGYNKDNSSSFVSFDVPLLTSMFPSMILASEGF